MCEEHLESRGRRVRSSHRCLEVLSAEVCARGPLVQAFTYNDTIAAETFDVRKTSSVLHWIEGCRDYIVKSD